MDSNYLTPDSNYLTPDSVLIPGTRYEFYFNIDRVILPPARTDGIIGTMADPVGDQMRREGLVYQAIKTIGSGAISPYSVRETALYSGEYKITLDPVKEISISECVGLLQAAFSSIGSTGTFLRANLWLDPVKATTKQLLILAGVGLLALCWIFKEKRGA